MIDRPDMSVAVNQLLRAHAWKAPVAPRAEMRYTLIVPYRTTDPEVEKSIVIVFGSVKDVTEE